VYTLSSACLVARADRVRVAPAAKGRATCGADNAAAHTVTNALMRVHRQHCRSTHEGAYLTVNELHLIHGLASKIFSRTVHAWCGRRRRVALRRGTLLP
jgi:hypothetical protein